MTKEKIIELIESLQAKKKAAQYAKRRQITIEQMANTDQYIDRINSVCDRLAFNFNMLPDSASFLENTIAEAELYLS